MTDDTQRAQQMARLIELKDLELDQASQRLQAQERELTREQAQLTRLETYYNEYQSPQAQPPAQPRLMAMRGAFVTQLRDGIAQQQKVVAAAQQRFDHAQQEWFRLRKVKELLGDKLSHLNEARAAAADKRRDEEVQAFFQYRQSH